MRRSSTGGRFRSRHRWRHGFAPRPRRLRRSTWRHTAGRPRKRSIRLHKVKYRLTIRELAREGRSRKSLAGPGSRDPRKDGSHEQVWHCVPFSEGAQYGIELFYPCGNELLARPGAANCFSKAIGANRPRARSSGRPSVISEIASTPTSFLLDLRNSKPVKALCRERLAQSSSRKTGSSCRSSSTTLC
jgi:hypothetical protein